MTQYRTTGHDIMRPARAKTAKPGKVAANKLGVYDRASDGTLRLRGQVGPLATAATASRFHGKLGSTIQRVAGQRAWVAPARVSGGEFGSAQRAKRAAQLRQDKGSVRK